MNKNFGIKIITAVVALIVFVGVLIWANQEKPGFTVTADTGVEYETAKVISVVADNSVIDESTEGVLKGSTDLEVEILTGRYKGNRSFVTNYYSALYNVVVDKSDTLSVRIDTTGENEYTVAVYNYNRIPLMVGLIILFATVLILMGGKQGAKAFIGLVFTVISFMFILLPLCLKGFNPIVVTIILIAVTSLLCFILIGGIQVKTVTAAIGSTVGVCIAALLGQIAAVLGGVTTFQMDEAEALLLVKSTFDLNMRGLFTAGILIAAMGAVMDIAMSIASAMDEIYAQNHKLSVKDLFTSGMTIGKDAMGTMANTLILAYVGSSLNMMVLIYSYGVSARQLLNTDFVAIELIRAIAGSVGIICTVPAVSIIGAFALKKYK